METSNIEAQMLGNQDQFDYWRHEFKTNMIQEFLVFFFESRDSTVGFMHLKVNYCSYLSVQQFVINYKLSNSASDEDYICGLAIKICLR